jgi:hypothetical protein
MNHITTLEATSTIGAMTSPRLSISAAPRHERRFFGGMAVVLALTVLAGFSRTYYFNDFVAAPFELSPLLKLHGAAYTAWMVLLVTQTTLIATHRVNLHRRLGVAGAALAVLMVVLGTMVAVSRTANGLMLDRGVPRLVFLAVPLVGMIVFPCLLGAALWLRRRSAAHKRLVLIATLELVTAGVSRLPVVETWGPLGFFGVIDLFVIALVVYDLVALKRVHPATLWGGLFFVASQPLRLMIGGSATWLAVATWLTS